MKFSKTTRGKKIAEIFYENEHRDCFEFLPAYSLPPSEGYMRGAKDAENAWKEILQTIKKRILEG